MKKLKILVMADGNSIHTEKWLLGLSMRDEFELYLLTMNPVGVRDEIKTNTKIKHIFEIYSNQTISASGNNYQYLLKLSEIKKIVKNIKPDIISTIYLTSYGFIGALVKNKALLCHFMIGTDIMVTPDKNLLYKWITKYTLSQGDLFVSASQTLTKKLKMLYPIPKNRLLTQQYGVMDEVINYPVQDKRYDFVSNRAWVENSNILFMLDIFSKLNFNGTIAMIGDGGPFEGKIRSRIASMHTIKHMGTLPYMENIDIVARSKFYLSLTSSDGASLSLMEAMTLGAIPIVSDIEPNREWVEDNINGFLINLDDPEGTIVKFEQIIMIPEEQLREMRKKNKELIKERGSFTKNMNRLSDSIIDIISKKN